MVLPDISVRRVAATVGYLLFGTVAAAVLLVGMLWLLGPIRQPLYAVLYAPLGPWTATTTVTVLTFAATIALATGVPALVAGAVAGRIDRVGKLAGSLVAWVLASSVGIVATAWLEVPGFAAALATLSLFAVLALLSLWRLGAWRGAGPAFVGSLPVAALAVLALGFGLGWGGSYVVVATEVPASAVNGTADATFADAPWLAADLFGADEDAPSSCERDGQRRTCRLYLRGYDREARAGRFLSARSVRCPYLQGPVSSGGSFVAEHEGSYYRVRCVAVGD